VRILQVTDCHIIPEGGSEILGTDTFRALQRVLETALALREPPELVVATGDLSDDGSEASYKRLRHLLLDTHLPVYVLPGNHDSVSGMQRFLAGGAIKTTRHVDLQPWRLVFLNSKVADRSYGYLEDSELEFLVGAFTEDPQRPVAVCLHHSPTRPCPFAPRRAGFNCAYRVAGSHSHHLFSSSNTS
jgi:3',5'-cyclic-AMP phosphodiesterase